MLVASTKRTKAEQLAQRRETHRVSAVNKYNSEKAKMARLRTEKARLEAQLRSLTASADDGTSVSDGHTDAEADELVPASTVVLANNRIVRKTIDSLLVERDELTAKIADAMKMEARLDVILKEYEREAGPPFVYMSLPDDKYLAVHELVFEAQLYAIKFFENDMQVGTGSSVFGWRDYRSMHLGDRETIDFALQKEFKSRTADEFEARVWQLFSSPDEYVNVYNQDWNPRLFLLQQLDKDTFLYHSTIHPTDTITSKAVFAVSRMPIDGGCVIVFREINREFIGFFDADELKGRVDATKITSWDEMFMWTIIKEKDQDTTIYHFGGRSKIYYLLEVLFVVLRWQTMILGPLCALPSSA